MFISKRAFGMLLIAAGLVVLGLTLVVDKAVAVAPHKTAVAPVIYEHRTVTIYKPCSTVVKKQASPAGWDHWRTTSKKVRWHQCG